MIEGEKVVLRPITKADASAEYLSWLNDDEVIKGLETVKKPYTMAMLEDYIDGVLKNPAAHMFMIFDKKTNKAIGTSKVHNINTAQGTCNLGMIIGDKSYWRGGYGSDALRTTIGYAFNTLGIRKICESVYSNNPAALLMDMKIGFVVEGVQKEQVLVDGKYIDKIIIALFARDWNRQ